MKNVIIASLNPAKINAVKSAFELHFPIKLSTSGISVPSEVADQPMTNEETKAGALNRVRNAKQALTDGDFYVGLKLVLKATLRLPG